MAYILSKYKVTSEHCDQILKNMNLVEDLTWETLLMVDYVYHHEENDYDNGLSFLDRLNRKLGRFHLDWVVNEWKDIIRNSSNPTNEFIRVVSRMLESYSDVMYYGV